jgi:hypothetical protein
MMLSTRIVGQRTPRHLRGDLRQRLAQEVRPARRQEVHVCKF